MEQKIFSPDQSGLYLSLSTFMDIRRPQRHRPRRAHLLLSELTKSGH